MIFSSTAHHVGCNLTWFRGVFCVIEHQHVTGGGLGGDDAGVLGHIAGSVHFSLVVDLDFNLDFTTD